MPVIMNYNLQIKVSSKRSYVNPMESQGLILKPHKDDVINNALSVLDKPCVIYNNDKNTESNNAPIKPFKNQIVLSEKEERNDHRINNHIQQNKTKSNMHLIKKYYHIWKEKTFKKHETQKSCHINEHQINKFIDNLKEKRAEKLKKHSAQKSTNSNNSTIQKSANSEIYENRYKAQRDIILMQKSKLLEQEQKIHELQFGKICEELQTSYNDSQTAIKKLLTKFSTRTKIKTGVPVVEEPKEIQMKINKVPKLVKMMEQRAQERELKRQIIQERKRLIDEERQRLIAEQIENKRMQDEDEKKRALEAIKDRRRKEIEEEKRKQAEKANFLRKCKLADSFYLKSLKKRSMKAFKLIMQMNYVNENISMACYEAQLLRKHFYTWRAKVKDVGEVKEVLAVEHYQNNLKNKCLIGLRMIQIKGKQNMQVAIDYNDYQIQCKVFKEFYLRINNIKIRRYYLMNVAMKHYKTRLLVQSFYQWKSLPAVLQLERAKEEKKRKWREKVLEVLPDYKPPEL